MEAGLGLTRELRAMTTLPFAGIDLLRTIDPQHVSQLEVIKGRLTHALSATLQETEDRVAECERAGTALRADSVDESLQAARAAAYEDAEKQLLSVVSQAGEDFRERFAKARALLGDDWPLRHPFAVPAAMQPIHAPAVDAPGASSP